MRVDEKTLDEYVQGIEAAIPTMPATLYPELLGNLTRLDAQVRQRMNQDLTAILSSPPIPKEDRLLNVAEAAAKLGVTKDHLYHKADRYSFTMRIGSRLRFSLLGMEKWMRAQTQKRIA